MVYKNVVNIITRNNYPVNVLLQVDNIFMFIEQSIEDRNITPSQYAMMVNL